MKYTFNSGFLAAKGILNGKDYEEMAKKYFVDKIKAYMVNRYLWERFRKNRYSAVLRNGTIMRNLLYSMHNYNVVQKMIYPFAVSYMRKKYVHLL